MEKIELFFKTVADFLWGDWLLVALLGLGLFYTVMTGCVQLRCVKLLRKGFFQFTKGKKEAKDEKKCSSYQVLCAAVASCVGSGNSVGVSTAILAGGPMYYIEKGMGWKWAGVSVAVLLFIQNSGGTLIQSNTISNVVNEAFHGPFLVTGLVLAVVMSLIIRCVRACMG